MSNCPALLISASLNKNKEAVGENNDVESTMLSDLIGKLPNKSTARLNQLCSIIIRIFKLCWFLDFKINSDMTQPRSLIKFNRFCR